MKIQIRAIWGRTPSEHIYKKSDHSQENRHQKHYGGDWILKGPGTLVSEDSKIWLNLYSNGWLGTAGMGDVLAGIIAGLWASGSNTPYRSAVYLQTQCAKNFLRLNSGAGLTASNISELIGCLLYTSDAADE